MFVTVSLFHFSLIFEVMPEATRVEHSYLKKSRLLKFCYVAATSTASFKGIFAAATNITNKTNKADNTCHSLISISFLDVNGVEPLVGQAPWIDHKY